MPQEEVTSEIIRFKTWLGTYALVRVRELHGRWPDILSAVAADIINRHSAANFCPPLGWEDSALRAREHLRPNVSAGSGDYGAGRHTRVRVESQTVAHRNWRGYRRLRGTLPFRRKPTEAFGSFPAGFPAALYRPRAVNLAVIGSDALTIGPQTTSRNT